LNKEAKENLFLKEKISESSEVKNTKKKKIKRLENEKGL
jgi:hypothetical protein